MKVAVCRFRCGYASDEFGFCEDCGAAMTIVDSRELTMGECLCRLGVVMGLCWREVKAAIRRIYTRGAA